MSISSRHTRVTLDADRTISEGTIRVDGILVSNASAGDVEVVFTDKDGVPLMNFAVASHDTEDFSVSWIADNGLLVGGVSSVDVVVTVVHSADGA